MNVLIISSVMSESKMTPQSILTSCCDPILIAVCISFLFARFVFLGINNIVLQIFMNAISLFLLLQTLFCECKFYIFINAKLFIFINANSLFLLMQTLYFYKCKLSIFINANSIL